MREVGFVIGRTSTKWITVRLSEEVLINDLVIVGKPGVDGRASGPLGVVRSMSYSNPTMSPYSPFTPRNMEAVRPYEYLNASVELYGTVRGSRFDPGVSSPVRTGTSVYRIEEGDLGDLELVRDPICLGEHPTSKWPIPLDPRAVDYHLAVVGATGSGKSHLVRLLIRELLRVGKKVLVFDHTGADYAPHFPDNVIKDVEIFPDLTSLAEVLAQKVVGKEYLDDVEVALYCYLYSGGDMKRAKDFLDGIGLTEPRSKGSAGSASSESVRSIIETISTIRPEGVDWDTMRFMDILKEVMERIGRRNHTVAKVIFRLARSGIRLESFNGRPYTIESIVNRAVENDLMVLDISNETLPLRYGIMKGVVAGLMDLAEKKGVEGGRLDVAIVVDEAQVYARGQPPTEALSDVARRGRKWGVGLILVSQRWVSDLDTNIRANINSVLFSSLQSSTDLDDIGKVVDLGGIDVGVLGTGDFYVTGLLSPFRRPILLHTYGDRHGCRG